MESEEIISNARGNNEEENKEEQENEEQGNENRLNMKVKEEREEKDEPIQEIKMAKDEPEENENEEEEKKEGKEEEEVEEEVEVEEEKEDENEGVTELKIKKDDDDEDEEHLEKENNIKEDKESPIEESGNKDNEDASKGSEDNADEEHEQSEEGKEVMLKIQKSDEKKGAQNYNLNGTEVSATYSEDKDNMNIVFKKSSFSPNLILHWGLYNEYPIKGWYHPNRENYPRNTREFDEFALQTEFVDDSIELDLPKNDAKGISFVFYNPNIKEWYNNYRKDFQIGFNN